MNDYYELRVDIDPCTEDMTDYLAALLGDAGYESFVPDKQGLTAYVKAEDYSAEAVEQILTEEFPFEATTKYRAELVIGQDWNAEWEKNYFKPIIVGEDCVIHSSFHHDIPQLKYDIVIDPKMAFGTGHHATTSLIIRQLLDIDIAGKSVIDMGTGTGILAILAAMRGASDVYAVEIDAFAYENAMDNVVTNGHPEIKVYNGDAAVLDTLPSVDFFIANINRNVITADLSRYVSRLKAGGTMLLSGFYEHDIPVVMETATPLGLTEVEHHVMGDNWTVVRLTND